MSGDSSGDESFEHINLEEEGSNQMSGENAGSGNGDVEVLNEEESNKENVSPKEQGDTEAGDKDSNPPEEDWRIRVGVPPGA